MNERIKELAEQAELNATLLFNKEKLEKFAELVVTDTISVLQKRFMGDLNREDMEVRRCIEDIQKHFGI